MDARDLETMEVGGVKREKVREEASRMKVFPRVSWPKEDSYFTNTDH